jgi:hypothetical protein
LETGDRQLLVEKRRQMPEETRPSFEIDCAMPL